MLTVVCKISPCPFNSGDGFCRNKVLGITEQGFCGYIYNKKG